MRGGSADASIPAKRTRSEGLALEMKLPHVRLVDGMGGGGSVKTIEMAGRTYIPELRSWEVVVRHLAVAPSVSLALGSVAGIGAARVCTAHYSVIVRDTAQMMIAGPALVEWAGGGTVPKEELGHARIHTANGAIDDAVDTEAEAFDPRPPVPLLPADQRRSPAAAAARVGARRRPGAPRPGTARLRAARPEAHLPDARAARSPDRGPRFILRDRPRLGPVDHHRPGAPDGWPIAIFAEDVNVYGGGWDADSCRKLSRLIDLASTFHLPLLHLEDCPGFLIGRESEHTATIRFGSQVLAALGQCTTPFCCVVIRKAFGVAGGANHKPGSHHFRYAWPSGDWGSLPIEGGIEVAYKAELAEAEDYDAHLARIKERLNQVRSPFRSAEYFEIEEIIDPRDTRPILCRWPTWSRSRCRSAGRPSLTGPEREA